MSFNPIEYTTIVTHCGLHQHHKTRIAGTAHSLTDLTRQVDTSGQSGACRGEATLHYGARDNRCMEGRQDTQLAKE